MKGFILKMIIKFYLLVCLYLYFWFYFLNQKVIDFGIVELLIVDLISLYWFPLKIIEIELILCSIEFIRFHIGIYIVKKNQSIVNNSKLWNTLNFEAFSMAILFFSYLFRDNDFLNYNDIWINFYIL